jgi:hypothetical protein
MVSWPFGEARLFTSWLGQKRERGRGQGLIIPLSTHPNSLTSFYLLMFIPPPNSIELGSRVLTHEVWGTVQIHTTAVTHRVMLNEAGVEEEVSGWHVLGASAWQHEK